MSSTLSSDGILFTLKSGDYGIGQRSIYPYMASKAQPRQKDKTRVFSSVLHLGLFQYSGSQQRNSFVFVFRAWELLNESKPRQTRQDMSWILSFLAIKIHDKLFNLPCEKASGSAKTGEKRQKDKKDSLTPLCGIITGPDGPFAKLPATEEKRQRQKIDSLSAVLVASFQRLIPMALCH